MALENNLGVQAEQLTPQIQTYALAGARRVCAEPVSSFDQDAAAPRRRRDFLTGGGDIADRRGFPHDVGVQQLVPWGGGRYTLALDASSGTTSDASSRFNPQLDSNLDFQLHAAAAAQLQDRRTRQQLLISAEEAGDRRPPAAADASRRRRGACATRTSTWSARSRSSAVAQQSLDLARQSLKKNERPRRGRHDGADRHRRGRRPKSPRTRNR